VGEKFDALLTQVDAKARKVTVSIKALEIADEKEAVAQYGSTDSGASLGDILGAALSKAKEEDSEEPAEKPKRKSRATKSEAPVETEADAEPEE
jgi:small subunit ribosomal protein S1